MKWNECRLKMPECWLHWLPAEAQWLKTLIFLQGNSPVSPDDLRWFVSSLQDKHIWDCKGLWLPHSSSGWSVFYVIDFWWQIVKIFVVRSLLLVSGLSCSCSGNVQKVWRWTSHTKVLAIRRWDCIRLRLGSWMSPEPSMVRSGFRIAKSHCMVHIIIFTCRINVNVIILVSTTFCNYRIHSELPDTEMDVFVLC